MKLRTILFSGLFVGGLALGAAAQDFKTVSASVEQDLIKANEELAALQKKIGEERVPLAQRISDVEQEVLNKRAELDKRQRSHDNDQVDLNVIKDRVKKQKDELDYLNNLSQEFANLFESHVHISELPVYEAKVRAVRQLGDNPDVPLEERLEKQLAFLGLALDRMEKLSGGYIFEGDALSTTGVKEKGKIALLGPLALFASANGNSAGMVDRQRDALQAAVIPVDAPLIPLLREVVNKGSGELPFDPSLGNAIKIEAAKDGVVDQIKKGGVVMYPMLAFAGISLIIGIIKYFQLAGIRLATPRDLQLIVERVAKGSMKDALSHAKTIKGPMGELLSTAVTHAQESKEFLEEVLYERMLNVKPALEKMLPFIALTAATAPLLGLLGTVTGMITTFNMISVFGTGDPKTLSGGISEALITTEWGLFVAIPALLLHSVLSRKVKAVLGSMEQTSVAFINGVPDEIPAEAPKA